MKVTHKTGGETIGQKKTLRRKSTAGGNAFLRLKSLPGHAPTFACSPCLQLLAELAKRAIRMMLRISPGPDSVGAPCSAPGAHFFAPNNHVRCSLSKALVRVSRTRTCGIKCKSRKCNLLNSQVLQMLHVQTTWPAQYCSNPRRKRKCKIQQKQFTCGS